MIVFNSNYGLIQFNTKVTQFLNSGADAAVAAITDGLHCNHNCY